MMNVEAVIISTAFTLFFVFLYSYPIQILCLTGILLIITFLCGPGECFNNIRAVQRNIKKLKLSTPVSHCRESRSSTHFNYSDVNGVIGGSDISMPRTPFGTNSFSVNLTCEASTRRCHPGYNSVPSSPNEVGIFGYEASPRINRSRYQESSPLVTGNTGSFSNARNPKYSSVGHLPTIRLKKSPLSLTKPFPIRGPVTVKIARASSPPTGLSTIQKLTSSFGERTTLQENRNILLNALRQNSRKRDKPEAEDGQPDEIPNRIQKKQCTDAFTPPISIIDDSPLSFSRKKGNKRAAPAEPPTRALKVSKRFKNNSVISSLSSSKHFVAIENSTRATSKRKQDYENDPPSGQKDVKKHRPTVVNGDPMKCSTQSSVKANDMKPAVNKVTSSANNSVNTTPKLVAVTSPITLADSMPEPKLKKQSSTLTNAVQPPYVPLYLPTLEDHMIDRKRDAVRLNQLLLAFQSPDASEEKVSGEIDGENQSTPFQTTLTSSITTATTKASSLLSGNTSQLSSTDKHKNSSHKISADEVVPTLSGTVGKPFASASSTGFSGISPKTLNSSASSSSISSSTVTFTPASVVSSSGATGTSSILSLSLSFTAPTATPTAVLDTAVVVAPSEEVEKNQIQVSNPSTANLKFLPKVMPLPATSSANVHPIPTAKIDTSQSITNEEISASSFQFASTCNSKATTSPLHFTSSPQNSSINCKNSAAIPQMAKKSQPVINPLNSGGFSVNSPAASSSSLLATPSMFVSSATSQNSGSPSTLGSSVMKPSNNFQFNLSSTSSVPTSATSSVASSSAHQNLASVIASSTATSFGSSGSQFSTSGTSFSQTSGFSTAGPTSNFSSTTTPSFGSPAAQSSMQLSAFGSSTPNTPSFSGFKLKASETSSPFKFSTPNNTGDKPPPSLPAFGVASTAPASSSFTFGASNITVPISSPAIQTNSTGCAFPVFQHTGSSGGFQFNKNSGNSIPKELSSSGGGFQSVSVASTSNINYQPHFNFGSGAVGRKTDVKSPPFQFGQSVANAVPSSSQFTFSGSGATETSGNTSFAVTKPPTTPFTFNPSHGSQAAAGSTPFQFGAPQSQPAPSTSSFKFGTASSQEPAKPNSMFQFGAGAAKDTPTASPFQFEQGNTVAKPETGTATFQFGASRPSSFQFGSNSLNQNSMPTFSATPSTAVPQRRMIHARRRKQ